VPSLKKSSWAISLLFAVYNGQTVFGTEIVGKLASILTDQSPQKQPAIDLSEREESNDTAQLLLD
jgi:hypothetical protein